MKPEEVKVGDIVTFRPFKRERKAGKKAEVIDIKGEPGYAHRAHIRFEDDEVFSVWLDELAEVDKEVSND